MDCVCDPVALLKKFNSAAALVFFASLHSLIPFLIMATKSLQKLGELSFRA